MSSHCRNALRVSLVMLIGMFGASAVDAELKPEEIVVAPPIAAKNRIYVLDIAINHIADGKLHVVDGDSLRYLGVIGSGFGGQSTLSNDKKEIIIATGYLSRGQRGERNDIIEVWDADTLAFKYEVAIPNKRAIALNYEGLLRLTADGRWLLIQNATPGTSLTVVDLQNKQAAGEIDMPGCYGIYPSQSNAKRFASLCGDGTVATVTLDDSGKVGSRSTSGKLFDPDEDALFISGEQDGDRYHFVSFKGNVVTLNVAGEQAAVESSWSLLRAGDKKKAWRPGGYQPAAFSNGRLYVAMHPEGAEGSHKNPAGEVWVFDLANKKRIARLPGHNAIALETSEDGSKLYAIDPIKLEVVVYDKIGAKPKIRATKVGETAVQLLSH